VKCKARFFGERITDLPFSCGEVLDVLEKPEEEWWIARNAMGSVGFIPTNYVQRQLEVHLKFSNECLKSRF
jgi:proto-oncogene C-crk